MIKGLFGFKPTVGIGTRDIHNHLLPGVDDGFRHTEDSIAAIKRMAEQGCKEFIFTPHMNPDVYPEMTEDKLKKAYNEFKAIIPAELGIKTCLAAEYMVVKDFQDRAGTGELLTFPDESILIEMSYYFRSENLEDTIFALISEGFKPILAHPERYLYMTDNLSDFDHLRDMGCRFQMNRLSLTGIYGGESVTIIEYLLSRGMYDFTATDLHTLSQLDSLLGIKVPRRIYNLLPR